MSKLKKLIALTLSSVMIFTLVPKLNTQAYDDNVNKTSTQSASTLPNRLMVGYWHNFDNNSKVLKLREVNDNWDIINISFGETDATKDKATILFNVDTSIESEEEFISDVKYLQSKGKKIVLSIGGMYGEVYLNSEDAKNRFVNSISNLIDKYGFDGLDLDLEHYMNSSDDFKNPKSAQNIYLIKACRELHDKYGENFILAMAPETAYVQGLRMSGSGGYLPLIYGVRDILTYIHVQLYNSGPMSDTYGAPIQQGSADFIVAMTEMLLNGFEVGYGTGNMFPALREDQVIIGLPSCTSAAPNGGYVSNDELTKAINYLATGKSYGGKYVMQNPDGYPGLRGVMSWSANWDAAGNFSFSNNARKTLDSLPVIENTLQAGQLFNSSPKDGSFDLTISVPKRNLANRYELYENNNLISSGNLTVGISNEYTTTVSIKNKSEGFYTYNLVLKDSNNNSVSTETSVQIRKLVVEPANPDVNGDGFVDINDLSEVAKYYNSKYGTTDYNSNYDINGDGIIDIYDLVQLASNYKENPYPNDTWVEGKQYYKGDTVIYHNETYECVKWDTKTEAPDNPYGPWQKK